MNHQVKNNRIRAFFFVAISLLYLTVFENDLYGSVNYSHVSDQINIELVFQPESDKEIQPFKSSSPPKPRKQQVPYYLENSFKSSKKLLLSVNDTGSNYFNIQKNGSLLLHNIISILQKNNTWHQSPDDDAFLSDFC